MTAEAAFVLPLLVAVLALALGALRLAADEIRCIDAARVGARAAARGDPPGEVMARIRQAAPAGSTVSVSGADSITVAVAAPMVGGHAWLGVLPRPQATAQAARESTEPPP